MRTAFMLILALIAALGLPLAAWAQDKADDDAEAEDKSIRTRQITGGVYYLFDGDSYRYGKYSGLTEEGGDLLLDLLFEKRPDPNSMDTVRWRLQGWRLGLDSRRLEFVYHDQGKQKFRFDYRQIPNNRIDDGLTARHGIDAVKRVLEAPFEYFGSAEEEGDTAEAETA